MAYVWIAALWVAFAATHMGLSSLRLRPRLVARLGERGFLAAYSLVALALFVPLVRTYYAHKHTGPLLWTAGGLTEVRWAAYGLIGAAFALVIAGLLQPSPAAVRPGRPEVRGVARITRHPLLMGIGLWGLAHLLATTVHAAEFAFFVGFPIFAVIGCDHQDQRKVATLGEPYRAFVAATPFVPFSRASSARGLLEGSMPLAVAAGIALAIALRRFAHGWLAG
jgi:uncharacterized membrane protein